MSYFVLQIGLIFKEFIVLIRSIVISLLLLTSVVTVAQDPEGGGGSAQPSVTPSTNPEPDNPEPEAPPAEEVQEVVEETAAAEELAADAEVVAVEARSLQEIQLAVSNLTREVALVVNGNSDIGDIQALAETTTTLLDELDAVPGADAVALTLQASLVAISDALAVIQRGVQPIAEVAQETQPLLKRAGRVLKITAKVTLGVGLLVKAVSEVYKEVHELAVEIAKKFHISTKKTGSIYEAPGRVICSISDPSTAQFKCARQFLKKVQGAMNPVKSVVTEIKQFSNTVKECTKSVNALKSMQTGLNKVLNPISSLEDHLNLVNKLAKKLKAKLNSSISLSVTFPDPEFQDLTHQKTISLDFNIKQALVDVKKEVERVLSFLGRVEREAIKDLGLNGLEERVKQKAKDALNDIKHAANEAKKHAPKVVRNICDDISRYPAELSNLKTKVDALLKHDLSRIKVPSAQDFSKEALVNKCNM